ncbi:flagellar assembly protein FliH [Desulforamulus putei DSM 12395]|uniref:Flagellar assembly protein FliH n=1 Tax=Desulforamulus putei DSM 12395 TaxID=1121429 RepID=A0A1M5B472_9FIRM|nr:FliH/SctL family protein [Desulforamulus putei]SHF37314.1 flagellar assembly protein FliH [Desulforamulus putei DSM 12395]
MFRVIKSAPVDQADQVLPLRQLSLPPSEESGHPTPEELLMMARQQAAEMIARARREAAEIIEQARAEAALSARQIKEQARQDGWQEGITASEKEAEEIRRQAREVLFQAQDTFRHTLEKMESEIVDLAVDIAERVVMTQLAVEPQTVMEIARECMELVKNRPLVNIYVNHADLAIIEQGKNQLLQGLPGKVELNVLVDNGIKPGGCRIETDQGQVDATLETRWQEVLKALYGREE